MRMVWLCQLHGDAAWLTQGCRSGSGFRLTTGGLRHVRVPVNPTCTQEMSSQNLNFGAFHMPCTRVQIGHGQVARLSSPTNGLTRALGQVASY